MKWIDVKKEKPIEDEAIYLKGIKQSESFVDIFADVLKGVGEEVVCFGYYNKEIGFIANGLIDITHWTYINNNKEEV